MLQMCQHDDQLSEQMIERTEGIGESFDKKEKHKNE
jgi:hypothetical protein